MPDKNENENPNNYTVQQGDYVSKIAAERGLSDFKKIWDHAQNQQLKQSRQSPNILAPGDILFIPDKEIRTEARSTDSLHPFVLSGNPLKVRIILKDMADKPVAGKTCELKVAGSPDVQPLNTDSQGMVEREIQPNAGTGKLKLKDEGRPIDLDTDILIGHLDPIDKITGWKGRLNNLGYDAGEVNAEETLQLKSAIEEFQCDNKLTVDAICGPITQAKLKQVHGC